MRYSAAPKWPPEMSIVETGPGHTPILQVCTRVRDAHSLVGIRGQRWNEAQRFSKDFGIVLPDYTEKGAEFAFSALNANATPLAKLLPLTTEGTDRILGHLIDRMSTEHVDELSGRGAKKQKSGNRSAE